MNSYLSRRLACFQEIESYSVKENSDFDNNLQRILYLDSNENLQISKSFLDSILEAALAYVDPRSYSRTQYYSLIENLSRYVNVSDDEIFIGCGADGLINTVAGSIMSPTDSAVVVEPTFSMYRNILSVHQRKFREVRLREDFSLDIEKLKETVNGTDEVVFLCSPNNPSGNQFSRNEVKAILESTDDLIVLDEAYVEFAEKSQIDLLKQYENLFILRTFSKTFGLAGLRLGYAVTNVDLTKALRERISLPYPVSTYASTVGTLLLKNIGPVESALKIVKKTRYRFRNELQKIPDLKVFPSQGNFLLLEVPQSATLVSKKILELGVKIRVIEWIGSDANFVRVTVPPESELDRVMLIFQEVFCE